MSAAVISSLVRCDEWDRKYEKEDKTPQKRTRGCADQNPLDAQLCNMNVPEEEKVSEGSVRGKPMCEWE